MKMTIDEATLYMKFYKRKLFGWFHKTDREAFETVIHTMCKYKKIEQILNDWINDDSVGMSDYWMGRIKEVLYDRNN